MILGEVAVAKVGNFEWVLKGKRWVIWCGVWRVGVKMEAGRGNGRGKCITNQGAKATWYYNEDGCINILKYSGGNTNKVNNFCNSTPLGSLGLE